VRKRPTKLRRPRPPPARPGVVEFVVEEIRVALKPVQEAPQGVLCSIKVPTLIRRGDKLFKTVPSDEKADRNR